MYHRKFGILWKPLEYSLSANCLILKVCAKLHNLSITDWISKEGKYKINDKLTSSSPDLTSLHLTLTTLSQLSSAHITSPHQKTKFMVFKFLTNMKGQRATPEGLLGMKDVQQSRRFESRKEQPETGRTDEDIAKAHKNPPVPTVASRTCDKKTEITKAIFNAGIRYSVRSDNDFTFS